ncbi:hypothetical protein [Candidatus Poriferisodalis sp.]|uniref:hypothetical protein n=1 Tax=Candidatus Poriferisodalis sp. TaxID=3101277 RepID=UPI003B022C4B
MREQSELAFERMCEVKDEAIAIMHSHDAQFAELVRAISSEELVMALAQIQSLQASRHIGKELDRRGITWRK